MSSTHSTMRFPTSSPSPSPSRPAVSSAPLPFSRAKPAKINPSLLAGLARCGVRMDIKRKITEAQGPNPPTEQQLGISALAMGEDIRGLSIKEFAARANVSVASVHRFCKKLGLEGFKDLKVELYPPGDRSRQTAATWTSTFPSMPRPRPRRLWSAWKGSTRPRWPRRRSCSTPRSSTTPPN